MSEINLVPTDALTQRLLVDLLTEMFKHELVTRMAASHESSTVGVTVASAQPTQTDEQSDTATTPEQNEISEDCSLSPIPATTEQMEEDSG